MCCLLSSILLNHSVLAVALPQHWAFSPHGCTLLLTKGGGPSESCRAVYSLERQPSRVGLSHQGQSPPRVEQASCMTNAYTGQWAAQALVRGEVKVGSSTLSSGAQGACTSKDRPIQKNVLHIELWHFCADQARFHPDLMMICEART